MIDILQIENAYRLLPMQHGMLFQTLSSNEPGVYIGQVVSRLPRDLNVLAFERSWRRVIERHAVLRTSFLWEGMDEPLQRVSDQVVLSIETHDWTNVHSKDERQKLEIHLANDRNRGFDLIRPPLMRLALLKCANGEYLFLWTHHHALLDGRARVIVLREVSQFYEAFINCRELDMPLPPAYKEYVEWFYEQDWSNAKQFWRQMLAGYTPHPPLAAMMKAERPHAPEKYGTFDIGLSPSLKASLQSIAQRYRVTVNLVVQAVWALLLSRYTGEQGIVFGETRACRRPVFQGAASIVGMLMNTAPIKLQIIPDHPFNNLLHDLREQHVSLRKYEHTPLAEIREWSESARTSELFESIVVFEEYDLDSALRRDHCALWRAGIHRSVPTHYALTIVGYNKPELLLHILHDRTLIGDWAVQRIAGHLRTLLNGVVNNPETACRDLPLLSEEERYQVLAEWNRTSSAFPQERSLAELFEDQVEVRADAVAMKSDEVKVSYGELNSRANRWAHYLISLGVGPDVPVVIYAERSMEVILALLGVVKAGGAYVPLDPSQPKSRLEMMLAEIQPAAVLTDAGLEEEAPGGWRILRINSEQTQAELKRRPADNPGRRARAENLAYVMYTSGSTGRPKGVAVTHRNVARLVKGSDYVALGPEEALLQLASLAFDASTFEIWGALLEGGTLVVIRESVPTAREIGRTIALHRVTTMWLTASLFNAVVDESVGELAGVGQLLVGGEALSVKHVKLAQEALPGTDLINGYGPTEGTTFSCCYKIKGEDTDQGRSIPIGGPISNTTAYALNEAWELTPVGVEGELYIGGEGLARGYWDRPDLTAERFLPDPFSGAPGGRLYRTGDRVRWRQDGVLEFIGRRDDQIKIRGFRIEMGEIKAALERHAAVQEAVLLVHGDIPGQKFLTAYVVAKTQPAPGAIELRNFLRQWLPDYMVPSNFMTLDELPLTSNGKVDRKALSNLLEHERTGVDQSYVKPGTPAEEMLAGIWADVLRKTRVGIDENFFELGGDSLSIFRIVARVRQTFQVELPVRAMFGNPTVASLIPVIESAKNIRPATPAQTIHSYPRTQDLPLSFNEEVLWLMAMFYPAYLSFNTQIGARLHGRLDEAALKRSLNEIVRRHEILRTTFEVGNSQPVRIIASSSTINLVKVDLRHIARDGRDRIVRQLAVEEANLPFDLAKGPLLRVKLLEPSDSESVLLLTFHHIISDGWSMVLLSRELKTLYGAYSEGMSISLPSLNIQYTDYAIWKRDWLQGEARDSLGAFWKQRLNGITDLLRLPPDRPGFALPGLKEETLPFVIPEQQTESLRSLAREKGVTVFTILLSIFKLLLHRLVGARDVVVAIPVDERNRSELEGVMGLFVNLVVSHTRIDGDCRFTELVRRIFQATQESYAYQHLPFAMVEQTVGNHDLGRIIFDYMNGPDLGIDLPDLKAETFSVRGNRPFATDLILFAHEKSDRIDCSLIYKVDLFFRERIQGIAERLQKLIIQVLDAPDRSIHQYHL